MRAVRAFRSRQHRRHGDPTTLDGVARPGHNVNDHEGTSREGTSREGADHEGSRHESSTGGSRSIILNSVTHTYGHSRAASARERRRSPEHTTHEHTAHQEAPLDKFNPSQASSRTIYSVRNLSLRVKPGESVALLGPSGCGKTTLLRLIAGLERPLAGTISLGDRLVSTPSGAGNTWVAPESRRIGMVFQDWALFPHLTVGRNVSYGLSRSERTPGDVVKALDLVGLSGYADRMPSTLSGGQQQRVALARALAPKPGVLLLDEPFSNLDSSLREEVRSEIRRLLIELNMTAVFVTHDQDEAFVVGDRVGVLRDGCLIQVDTPDGLYRHPTDPFVADFVGTASWLRAQASGGTALTALGRLPLRAASNCADNGGSAKNGASSNGVASRSAGDGQHRTEARGGTLDVLIRPEQLRLAPGSTAEVELVEFYGHDSMVVANLDGKRLRVRCGPNPQVRRGDAVAVEFIGSEVVAFEPASASQN